MLDLCIASERIAAGGFPAAKLVIATAIAGTVIARHGSEAQRARWLPGHRGRHHPLLLRVHRARGGVERQPPAHPRHRGAGRDAAERPEDLHLRAESSEAMIVVAADPERGGLTLVVLPLPCEGVSHHPVRMSAPSFEQQWHVFYDDVAVPEDGVLGERGGGGRVLFDGLNPERLIVAGQAVGVGRWCLARAAEYASQRVVFDVPIGAHQAVQHPLAEALIALEGAWLLVARGARLHDAGRPAGLESNMAKIAACDAGLDAADRALQCFGGSATPRTR